MRTETEFNQAYTKHYGLVLNYLKGRFNFPTEVAEEVANDTFMKAYKNFDNFDAEKGNLPQWLCSVSFQIATDHIRTDHRRKFGNVDDYPEMPLEGATNRSADENIVEAEMQDALKTALMKLSYKNRMVAVLRLVNEKSTKEIAEIMDIPLNTVLVTIQRVKAQMRAMLEPQGYYA